MASYLERIVDQLEDGPVTFRPRGSSMVPIIRSGQTVTVVARQPGRFVQVGDIVLARVRGRLYLHLVSATQGGRVQIANNRGHVNGWTTQDRVYGIVTTIDT